VLFGEIQTTRLGNKMAANINQFINSFRTEVARPCNFEVTIIPNTNLLSKITQFSLSGLFSAFTLSQSSHLTMRCEGAELPSRTFALVDQKTYGPVELFPIQNSYDKVNFTFICSDNMVEKAFFDSWMDLISMSSDLNKVAGAVGGALGINFGGVNFDFEYKDNYEVPIIVTQFDLTGDPSYSAILQHAFPCSVNQLPLLWRDTDSYHRLVVTFAYRYFNTIPL
jgi:hypothetical protein